MQEGVGYPKQEKSRIFVIFLMFFYSFFSYGMIIPTSKQHIYGREDGRRSFSHGKAERKVQNALFLVSHDHFGDCSGISHHGRWFRFGL